MTNLSFYIVIEGDASEEEEKEIVEATKNLLKILGEKYGVGDVEWEEVEYDLLQQEDMP